MVLQGGDELFSYAFSRVTQPGFSALYTSYEDEDEDEEEMKQFSSVHFTFHQVICDHKVNEE